MNSHLELRCCAPFPKLTNVEHINHMCMKSVWIGYNWMCNIYFGMPFFFHSNRNRPPYEERHRNKERKNSRTHIKYIITILYIYFSTVYQYWRLCALQYNQPTDHRATFPCFSSYTQIKIKQFAQYVVSSHNAFNFWPFVDDMPISVVLRSIFFAIRLCFSCSGEIYFSLFRSWDMELQFSTNQIVSHSVYGMDPHNVCLLKNTSKFIFIYNIFILYSMCIFFFLILIVSLHFALYGKYVLSLYWLRRCRNIWCWTIDT